jgi:CheY-like chemotaxis protein
MHVLIVDDDVFIRRVIREKIKVNFDVSVTDAESGNYAISLIQNGEKFDIIISDYCMSDGDGEDLLRFIYANNIVVPFVLFTNAIKPELPEIDSQFLGIVEKLNFQEILDIIKKNFNYGSTAESLIFSTNVQV